MMVLLTRQMDYKVLKPWTYEQCVHYIILIMITHIKHKMCSSSIL